MQVELQVQMKSILEEKKPTRFRDGIKYRTSSLSFFEGCNEQEEAPISAEVTRTLCRHQISSSTGFVAKLSLPVRSRTLLPFLTGF